MGRKLTIFFVFLAFLSGFSCSSSGDDGGEVSVVKECVIDSDCESNKTEKYCFVSDAESTTGECVQCLEDSHCNTSAGFSCDLVSKTCKKGALDTDVTTDGNSDSDELTPPDSDSDSNNTESDTLPKDEDVTNPDSDTPTQTTCTPGEKRECYPKISTGYEIVFGGNSICKKGTQVCKDNGKWSTECEGAVLPSKEDCDKNDIDEDCDGIADNIKDIDGDGYTVCDGDCCETTDCASNPELVNPGAVEIIGNGLDDDCNDKTPDDKAVSCDAAVEETSIDAYDFAKAIDICETATMENKKWGVISAKFLFPDGDEKSNDFIPVQVPAAARKIRSSYGNLTVPKLGEKMAYLTTATSTVSDFPQDWFEANQGKIPNAPGCPLPSGSVANDGVMLELKIRVPTNAFGFSLNTYFYSEEYPVWVCSPYNDMFVMLLDSNYKAPSDKPELENPYDKNLAVYMPNETDKYPVGVNLASQSIPYDANGLGLFRHCKDQKVGTGSGAKFFDYTGCMEDDGNGNSGLAYLLGTDFVNKGGTGWLVSYGNVLPGEIITLRFAIWNTSDHSLPSAVLIDNFQWLSAASKPGTSGGN